MRLLTSLALLSMVGCTAPPASIDGGQFDAGRLSDAGQPDAGIDGGARSLPILTTCPSGTVDLRTESMVSVPGGIIALVKNGSTYRLERLIGSRCALTLDPSY